MNSEVQYYEYINSLLKCYEYMNGLVKYYEYINTLFQKIYFKPHLSLRTSSKFAQDKAKSKHIFFSKKNCSKVSEC